MAGILAEPKREKRGNLRIDTIRSWGWYWRSYVYLGALRSLSMSPVSCVARQLEEYMGGVESSPAPVRFCLT